jgi:hypothetical protein
VPISGHVLSNNIVEKESAPVFSSNYTVKGVLYIPYAEVKEPFLGWYDAGSGSSRIDYYGGREIFMYWCIIYVFISI